jgi:hypothetical protein
MEKFLKIIGIFTLALVVLLTRVFLLCKIWDCTVVHLGAPHFGWTQMFMLVWFLDSALPRNQTSSETNKELNAVLRMASTIVALLISWGLAYWMWH